MIGQRIPRLVRSSFRRKLGAALLVVLVITVGMALGLYLQIGGLLGENVEQSMTAGASSEAGEIEEWVTQNSLLTRLLSDHPVYERDQAAVRSFLREQGSRAEMSIREAYVIDRGTEQIESALEPSREGQPIGSLPWEERFAFRDFEDVRITDPYTVNGTTVVAFISPIPRRPGSLLVLSFETASVLDRFDHPISGGVTRVVNSNGTVIVAEDPTAVLTQYQSTPGRSEIVSSGLRGTVGFTEEPPLQAETTEYVAAYAPVAGTDWVVIEHAPAATAYALLMEARYWIVGLAVFALAGLLSVVVLLGQDVTDALSAVRQRASRIEDGEYDVTFDVDRPDEFGDLNRSLASMRDTLQDHIEEIESTSADLAATNRTLQERSEMVQVLNRILRHNVRNDINVIAGRAEMARDRVDDPRTGGDLEAIQETAEDLSRLSDRTRQITNLVAESEATESVTLRSGVPPALESIGARPEATVEMAIEEGPTAVSVPEPLPGILRDVLAQIVENAEKPVTIGVRIRDETGGLSLLVDDDRSGLPTSDVEAVSRRRETALEHADGVALWLLEWMVERTGGGLCLDETDATLEIQFPADEERCP